MKPYAELSNLYNKVKSRHTNLKTKTMKPVLILFNQNVFDET